MEKLDLSGVRIYSNTKDDVRDAIDLIGEEVFVNNPFMASLVKSAKEVTNYGGAFLLYLIIYKIRLLHYLKEDGHEE